MRILPSTQISALEIRTRTIDALRQAGTPPETSRTEAVESFQQLLSDSIQEVNRLQHEADALSAQAALGDLQDVSQAVVAMEKAQLALELTAQVRNKLVEAYREIMRMPV